MTTSIGVSGVTFPDSTIQTTAFTGSGIGGIPGILGQVFTSSGTFTIPSGVTAVKVTVIGGGGGGGGGSTNGSAGGTSSFGSYVSCAGGGGGISAGGGGSGGAVTVTGVASSYTYPTGNGAPYVDAGCAGQFGGAGGAAGMPNYNAAYYVGGMNIAQGPYGAGGGMQPITGANVFNPVGRGSGGGGQTGAGGAGGGGLCVAYITGLTSGGTITVTIGSAGTGGSSPSGQNGTAGMVIVEW